MMFIIRGKKIPNHVRGYLRRFMTEVDSNFFVAQASRKVIDNLWEKIISSKEDFKCVLILASSSYEQGYTIWDHNYGKDRNFREIDEILFFGGFTSKNP